MTPSQWIRLLYSIVVFLFGLVLTNAASLLVQHIGLAFMVAGLVSASHEVVLRRLEGDEAVDRFAERIKRVVREASFPTSGIRLVADRRTDYDEYLAWAARTDAQILFFAGRSVLHRLDSELQEKHNKHAERVIAKRFLEGADIRVLLLDPRSDLVPRLAREEMQSTRELLSNIEESLTICEKTHDALAGKHPRPQSRLEVKVFDQVPYFAYHQVDDRYLIGFYFLSSLGHASPAYELIDQRTKDRFAAHFETLFNAPTTSTVLRIDARRHIAELNGALLSELREAIAKLKEHTKD